MKDRRGIADDGAGHFNVLMVCLLLSIVLLIATRAAVDGSAGTIPNWVPVVASLIPLAYYHLGYLVPRARSGLSQAAIDSVYYYGFLVTIVALGSSALAMAASGSGAELANPGVVISQFGVGLLATGYAVVARLHISAQSKLDDQSPDVLIDQYVARSRQLVDHLDLTLRSFDELATKCQMATQRIEDAANEAVRRNGEVLLAHTTAFEKQMGQILSGTKEGLIEIRGMVSDASFVAERKAFARSMKSIAEGTSKLNEEMQRLVSTNEQAGSTTLGAASANEKFANSLGDVQLRAESVAKATEGFATALEKGQRDVLSSSSQIKLQISESAKEISSDVQRTSAAANLLVTKIIEIAEIVIERTKGSATP